MIKSINMDITDENLSKFSEQHKEHEFAILFYDDKFDINKLTSDCFNFNCVTDNSTIRLYIVFNNRFSGSHIKIGESHNGVISVKNTEFHIPIMVLKILPSKHGKTTQHIHIDPNNAIYFFTDSVNRSCISIQSSYEHRSIPILDVELKYPLFANVDIFRYLVHNKQIICN